jgi:two-component system phosphate regulon sensor histidine kinase PhoR
MTQSPPRIAIATLVVLASAAIVALMAPGMWPVFVTLVGGGAAVLAMRRPLPVPPPPATIAPPPEPAPPPERLAATIGEAIADPLLITRDGRIIAANPAARALLGGHVLGEDVRLAIRHPAAAERLADPGGDRRAIDLVGLGKGEQRWALRASAVTDGYRAIHLVDQTARYAAERMRVDFVANASHELKTPLASLLGYIETLSDDEAGGDAALRERFFGIMAGEARRMQRLVEDLISLSRIEAEKYRLPDAPVDLAELAAGIVRQIAGNGDPRGADLVFEAEPMLPDVNGDRAQLSQLLYNLISNAMKYGRAGTPVTIRLAGAGEAMVRLTVTDRGEGIDPRHIPRLTERFYRIDAGRSRGMGGTGLGLAIVKHIVERHRGQLDIASEVGRGTSVIVLLPLYSPPALSSKSHLAVTRG